MQKTIFALSFPYSSHEKDGKDHAEKRYMQTGLLSPAASPSACRANQRRRKVFEKQMAAHPRGSEARNAMRHGDHFGKTLEMIEVWLI